MFQPLLFMPTVLALAFNIASSTTLKEDLTLTLQEKQLLDKFKLEVTPHLYQDYMSDEIYLVRWLRATNFNLEEAQSLLLKNIQWRQKNNIDSILDEDFSDITPYAHYKILGQAKDKSPVVYYELGGIDLRKMNVAGRMPRFERYMDRYLEEATTLARNLYSQNVTQYDLILNLEGLNVAQHACLGCLPSILYHFLSYENHYPGAVNRIIVLNANSALEVILEATKFGLSQRTRNALEVYGTNRHIWMKRLLDIYDTDILPTQVGGSVVLGFGDY